MFSIFAYKPEHVVDKNKEKYVAYVIAFHMTEVEYYEYKNLFVSGNKVKIREYYGKGGFDPLDNKNGYMHFVVVYKINNNKILIMNPNTGKEVIDIFDFSNMWTGYILLLEKVSELPVYKSNKIIKKIILKVLNDNKSNIIIVFILSFIFTLLSCIVGLYSQI